MGRRKYKRRKKWGLKNDSVRSILSIILFLSAVITFFSFFGQAAGVGFVAQEQLGKLFGWGAFLVPFLLADLGLIFFRHGHNRFATWHFFTGLSLLTFTLVSMFHLVFISSGTAYTEAVLGEGGGLIGYNIQLILSELISPFLAFLTLLAGFLVSLLILFDTSLDVAVSKTISYSKKGWELGRQHVFRHLFAFGSESSEEEESFAEEVEAVDVEEQSIKIGTVEELEEEEEGVETQEPGFEVVKPAFEPFSSGGTSNGDEGKEEEEKTVEEKKDPRVETVTNPPDHSQMWEYPPLSILQEPNKADTDRSSLEANAKVIEETLDSFGVQAKVVEVNPGPAITQYALELTHGTKISKITKLQNDLALALAAPTGTVRIEAPIPGRSLVGIEVPNEGLKEVTLKSVLTSSTMEEAKSPLTVALGEDVSGQAVVADISKMPHVLIAGSTGSGKSVLLNSIISTILFRASPSEVKMILVDPKRVELTHFRDIPHLLTQVVVEPEKVVSTLKWALGEMDRRYRTFEKAGVRNIQSFNEASGFQALPYIVIVVDELADVMMTAPREVESAICRIAQLARATGIHLILATQRPSTDVLTGLIKANITCRVAFNVSSMVDSRVIIDMPGAEKLLGSGDMLYVPPDSSKPMRIQGVYVSDQERDSLIDYLKSTGQRPDLKDEILDYEDEEKDLDGVGEKDELFPEAVELIFDEGGASTSYLQRKLRIGYNRAANIIDNLEEMGVVGPQRGSKKRELLVNTPEEILEKDNEDESDEESGGHLTGGPTR